MVALLPRLSTLLIASLHGHVSLPRFEALKSSRSASGFAFRIQLGAQQMSLVNVQGSGNSTPTFRPFGVPTVNT